MADTFRALCAELADSVELLLEMRSNDRPVQVTEDRLARARAALARPEPPSLKEQALAALKHAPGPDYPNPITLLTADEHALIRRALEALPD